MVFQVVGCRDLESPCKSQQLHRESAWGGLCYVMIKHCFKTTTKSLLSSSTYSDRCNCACLQCWWWAYMRMRSINVVAVATFAELYASNLPSLTVILWQHFLSYTLQICPVILLYSGNIFWVREHLLKKKCFLSGIARITSPPSPSPHFGQLVHLFSDVKTDVLRVWQKKYQLS